MEFANSLLQLVNNLWGLASRPLGSICNLKDNADLLRNETGKLKAKSNDVLGRVELEEGGGGRVQCKEEVANWLDTVQKSVGRADQILREVEERDRIKCLSRYLPSNCWLSYKLGKRVDQRLNEVRGLQPKEGEFGVVTSPLPPPPVLEMPMDETVGLDHSNLNEVWKWVGDKKKGGVIGLYGTGGVGKTTLMKRISNELSPTNEGFYVVIWVTVSSIVKKDTIQDTIRKRMRLEDEAWKNWSWDDRVHHLCQALTQKKFVLFLDDLWDRLDLSEIGVPRPGLQDGSKVVFTTRSKQVCDRMKADKKFEVQCLKPEEALQLFENNVGKSIVHSHPEILKLAKEVARECKGLPLALVVVGRAMASRETPGEWEHALATLRNNPHKLSGMVDEVYHILEFSYDSLDDITRACFLYCCLFPEDYPIRKNNLIELWIGGGLLGDTHDVNGMRHQGKHVLGSLKNACLLESDLDEGRDQRVKMHDVIRDMATWIARDRGKKENNLLVIENEEDMSAGVIYKWGEAKKLSLWGGLSGNIQETLPTCSQLETLFIRNTNATLVPSGFFYSTCLTVLDMSENRLIESFPKEICNLICLLYLNLSGTRIRGLPREIKNLTRLRWLLLDDTGKHFLIPTGAIASLPLNVFSHWVTRKLVNTPGLGQVNEEEIIEELKQMKHLMELSIMVSKASSAQKIFESPKLQKSTRRARITNPQNDLTSIVIIYSPIVSSGFSHLEELYLENCLMLKEMKITQESGRAPNCACFPNLVEVFVYRCGLLDLSWLVHAPKLSALSVIACESIEKIIGDGFAAEELAAAELFSRLEYLLIQDLPSLTSIYGQTLPFPQLEHLRIDRCPRLGKLPLDSDSARGGRLKELRVETREWWDKLEWDDEAARAIFTAKTRYRY